MIVDCYDPNGGVTVDFDEDCVTFSNGRYTTIAESLSDVIWALDETIKRTIDRNEYINKRLKQTSIVREPIKDGYKETTPPNDTLRVKLTNELSDNEEFLKEVKELKDKYKGGQNMIEVRLNKLKELHVKLRNEYDDEYSDSNHLVFCPHRDRLLDRLRDIETTFRMLGFKVQTYKIR